MKSVINNTTRSILIVSAVSFATVADAGTTSTTLSVTADVLPSCSVTTQPVVFGDLISGTSATGSVDVTCSIGLAYTIALDAGLYFDGVDRNVESFSSPNQSRYTLRDGTGSGPIWGDSGFGNTHPGSPVLGTGSGVVQAHTVFGHVQITSTIPGAYADVVNVTVHF